MNYLFIGNRFPIVEALLEQGAAVPHILTPPESYLTKELQKRKIAFTTVATKEAARAAIEAASFDVLVSNGCPFVLPVSALQKPGQRFVNIHPSPLPDLKGVNPINAAFLFNRSGGAACHVMDDSIDNGPLIARVEIPLSPGMDLGLLYQLSFLAERDVFLRAQARDFAPDKSLTAPPAQPLIYYTRKNEDLEIKFSESIDAIMRRVSAFAVPTQGAHFTHKGGVFKVMQAEKVDNPYLQSLAQRYRENEIAFRYDNSILIRKENCFLKLAGIIGNMELLAVGDLLTLAAQ